MQPWRRSHRADPAAAALADRHYSRQTPGARQFVPPGRCLVLLTADADAVWVTSWQRPEYVRHAWPGAWVCTLFRREPDCRWRASDLITAAVAATRAHWRHVPPRQMVTFIDPGRVRRKRDPGRCFRQAGWLPIGHTAGGLLALGLPPSVMPSPVAAGPPGQVCRR